jgi:hypothetical protein
VDRIDLPAEIWQMIIAMPINGARGLLHAVNQMQTERDRHFRRMVLVGRPPGDG